MMKNLNKHSSRPKAYTIIEVMIVVAIFGLLSATVYNVYGKIHKVANQEKLRTEVKTLNNAISIYQGFGGKFDDITDPAAIIGKLKSVAHSDVANRIPGLSASMVDARLSLKMQTNDESKGNSERVVWNPATNQFVVASGGGPGISSFGLEANPEQIPEPEERDFVHLYAENSTWVWEYEEGAMPTFNVPTRVDVTSSTDVDDGSVPTDEVPDTTPDPNREGLQAPTIDPFPSEYSIRDYDMPVTLGNPNRAGISKVYYSVDFGPWMEYSGSPLNISQDMNLAAQVVPKSRKDYYASAMTRGSFEALPVTLAPPIIDASVSSFGAFSSRYSTVSLSDPNPGDPSYIEYRMSHGPWQVYDQPFVIDSEIYEADVIVEARSKSDNIYYENSENSSSVIDYIPFSVIGEAEAEFHSAEGSWGLRWRQTADDNFYWGRTYNSYGRYINGLSESFMQFDGEGNDDTEFGIRFDLGYLDYYNGSILANTGASSVKLDLDLDLVISGYDAATNFTFDFDLINTSNYGNYRGNGSDAWGSADYVLITQSSQTNYFNLQGTLLAFTLEFGDASSNGFAEFDEFHVLEERAADTRVYGTLRLATDQEVQQNQ